ncbi:hypothetical protein [Jannaschia sp. R86511]|uniref:hypothetical protein n=1 Tax=Jannaschia sp. R86511 TaxID=3093853 RepID=UPI0036D2212F
MLLLVLVLAGCGAEDGELSANGASPSVAAPDLSTNAAVCGFVSEAPRHQPDTELLWAQVNVGTALEEVLAIGWQPGSFDSEADGDLLRAEQFYKTLPVARQVVLLRPGLDEVSVTFTGTNLEAARKTVFVLPASVVADYEDTPEGRNAVQQNLVQQRLELGGELPQPLGPNGLEVTDENGSLLPQC